jgi:hypothetical protein
LPDDPRIKLVEAKKFLIMNDNWENGFRHATGQWRMLLGDDDCLVPQALAIVAAALARAPEAEVMLWRWGGYVAPSWLASEMAGVARIPPYSGRVDVRTTEDIARLVYGFDPDRMSECKQWLPSVMRGVVRAEIIEEIWTRVGVFCHELSPDYGAAAQVLALAKNVHLLDMPLVILNHTQDSMVASNQGQTKIKAEQYYDMLADPIFHHTLVQTRYESNRPAICETLMRVREKYPEFRNRIPFNIIDFLEWHFVGLLQAELSGTQIDQALSEIEAVIATLPELERVELRSRIALRREDAADVADVRRLSPSLTGRIRIVLNWMIAHIPMPYAMSGRIAQRFGVDIEGQTATTKTIRDFAQFAGNLIDSSQRAGALI